MFVSRENNPKKKGFIKPNILRKNLETVPKFTSNELNANLKILSHSSENQKYIDASQEKKSRYKISKPNHIKNVASKIKLDTYRCDDNQQKMLDTPQSMDTINTDPCEDVQNSTTADNNDASANSQVELLSSYFIEEVDQKSFAYYESNIAENNTSEKITLFSIKEEDKSEIAIMDFNIDFSNIVSPTLGEFLLSNMSQEAENTQQDAIMSTSLPATHDITTDTVMYKCEYPDCDKQFPSGWKLKKHKRTHRSNTSVKVLRQSFECPVKNAGPEQDEPCGVTFNVRDNLLKHLQEDHTLEDAPHRCSVCGRQFFWLTGLRAHSRSHETASVTHACSWPGCDRVFLQACRLKEHERAHTGDKPYTCNFPNCGWSFRTASKLLRHTRQHTGDRRHRCEVCGVGFLRPEHCRNHMTSHERPLHTCTLPGCEETFINTKSLKLHLKKVHDMELKRKRNNTRNLFAASEGETSQSGVDTSFMIEKAASVDGRAARTHCTWPLPTRTPLCGDTEYELDGEVQVELSEGSESNNYTVKSDLFLHGNDLNNEDSNSCAEIQYAEEDSTGLVLLPHNAVLDTGLDLLPASDLMQEELMYTDTAVDESSFQVLLLNEELN